MPPLFLYHGYLLPLSIEIHGSFALVPRHFRSNWRAYAARTFKIYFHKRCRSTRPLSLSRFELFAVRASFFLKRVYGLQKRDKVSLIRVILRENLKLVFFFLLCCTITFITVDYDSKGRRKTFKDCV